MSSGLNKRFIIHFQIQCNLFQAIEAKISEKFDGKILKTPKKNFSPRNNLQHKVCQKYNEKKIIKLLNNQTGISTSIKRFPTLASI